MALFTGFPNLFSRISQNLEKQIEHRHQYQSSRPQSAIKPPAPEGQEEAVEVFISANDRKKAEFIASPFFKKGVLIDPKALKD